MLLKGWFSSDGRQNSSAIDDSVRDFVSTKVGVVNQEEGAKRVVRSYQLTYLFFFSIYLTSLSRFLALKSNAGTVMFIGVFLCFGTKVCPTSPSVT